jgi:L-idonate 5-dehydrogenase
MKAVVIHAAKDLRVEECQPLRPGRGQVAIAIGAGGICGSDLHYFNHGGFGAVRVKHPMVLGHEVAGTVSEVGKGVDNLAVGGE